MTRKKMIVAAISLLAVVVIGVLVYVVVDRHGVAGSDAVAVTATQPEATGAQSDTVGTAAQGSTDRTTTEDTSAAVTSAEGATTSYESVDADGNGYTATDSSYVSDEASITVTKLTTGSGADTITYYVADIQLSGGSLLQAGLADNARGTADTSDIADASGAVLAVNGDYFGARDDGIIIRNGEILRDKPVRTSLALYKDGHMEVFDETETSAQELLDRGVWNTYSFGPALLVDGVTPGNISTYEVEKNPKHPIQGRDPRTGIGIIAENHFVLVVVDGRQSGYSKGVTLEGFAQMFRDLGCTTAYNLDGGGSSTMYFMGQVINSPAEKGGQRDISDILFVG